MVKIQGFDHVNLHFWTKRAAAVLPQFYIQLDQEFFCLGRLGSQGSKEKKSRFEEFWATFEGVLGAKKNSKIF